MNDITVALTKGRLAGKTLSMFRKANIGLDASELEDSRKLIFDNHNGIRFFLAKGPDVPAYVAHGAADIGITGKDVILEESLPVYEVMDLGIGTCSMCICGPEENARFLNGSSIVRVATKYPHIALEYFQEQKHQNVQIIKLTGSMELAPIVGLCDVIVDIVETGTTLKENGLVVLEKITDISARMIVNQVSMKMKYDQIATIMEALSAVKES